MKNTLLIKLTFLVLIFVSINSFAQDTDGDGVIDTTEIIDATDENDPCDYLVASQTVPPDAAWQTLDCDGDGVLNGDELFPPNGETPTDSNDPCDFIASDQDIATVSGDYLLADCDGDGVTNEDELFPPNGGTPTNPADPCNFNPIDQDITAVSGGYLFADCDGDGVLNGDELFPPDGETPTDSNDPCDFVASDQDITTVSGDYLFADCDDDGVTNGDEIIVGTDPNDPCSLILAQQTVAPSTEWLALDCDEDTITNNDEVANGSDPLDPCDPIDLLTDTDGDGVSDCQEILDATDPNNNCDFVLTSINVTPTVYCNINTITGQVTLDVDENGCDASDVPFDTVRVNAVENTSGLTFTTFTQADGSYELHTDEGNYTITLNLDTVLYTITPTTHTANFVGADNLDEQNDFCVTQNILNDLYVNGHFCVNNFPRPGFISTYRIYYRNVGTNSVANGSVSLEYDNTKVTTDVTNQTVDASNVITFNFTNLQPLETRHININFYTFTIPTTNIGDVINFTTTINPVDSDLTPDDNIFENPVTVVGSWDPNDIHILEGSQILIENANKYLHFLIRFQNTGTADAINIMVANELDSKLDWSTFQLENLSHTGRVAIFNENQIEFIFEGINLVPEPDPLVPVPMSHGFITYKIKPKTNVIIGDIISGQANIYFDFNPAIVTNIATTEFKETLGIYDNELANAIIIYPNPTKDIISINAKNTQIVKLTVYSKLGQLIVTKTETDIKQIDLKELTKGLYFLKLEDIDGNIAIKKIIKE